MAVPNELCGALEPRRMKEYRKSRRVDRLHLGVETLPKSSKHLEMAGIPETDGSDSRRVDSLLSFSNSKSLLK